MLNQIADQLKTHRFVWYGPRALECWGLGPFLSIDAVFCCDYGQDVIEQATKMEASLFSFEQQTGVREKWDNFSVGRLFTGKTAEDVKRYFVDQQTTTHVIAFAAAPALEEFAASHPDRINVLAVPVTLKEQLDDKIYLRNHLHSLGIEPLPAEVSVLADVQFEALVRKFGLPFVVQFPIGASGSGTYFIHSADDLEHLRQNYHLDSQITVAKYIDGPSLSIHVTIVGGKIVLSYPTVQLVGLPECAPKDGVYCGSDFFSMQQFPNSLFATLFDQSYKIGVWLRGQGYRGVFGIDFLAQGEQVYPIEINPRYQASTDILGQVEAGNGEVPLTLLPLLEFMDIEVDDGWFWRADPLVLDRHIRDAVYPGPVDAAHIWLYNIENKDCVVRGELKPGVYTFAVGQLEYLRDGLSLMDCVSADEFIIACGVPDSGTLIKQGAMILQVQARKSVLDLDTGRLNPWAAAICEQIYRTLDLSTEAM